MKKIKRPKKPKKPKWMTDEVVKDWTTKVGLRAVLIHHDTAALRDLPQYAVLNKEWWCGYIVLSPGHPLYERHSRPQKIEFDADGCLPLADEFDDGGLHIELQMHGGLTWIAFNDYLDEMIGNVEKGWWIGFDTAHADDLYRKVSVGYCVEECESMAAQLHELSQ